jgi:hypothetical protein
VITVSPRARTREDRAGDPLDGLVNLFDLGIVLSVAFLIAALSSLHLALDRASQNQSPNTVTVPPGSTAGKVPPKSGQVIGHGQEVGKVYRLDDGRLIYVVPSQDAGGGTP